MSFSFKTKMYEAVKELHDVALYHIMSPVKDSEASDFDKS